MSILLDLVKYLGILFIGAVVGSKELFKGKLASNLDKVQEICLLFLLFIMGLTIGFDKNVIENLFSIGFNALIISIFTIVFSILAVRVVKNKVITRGKNNDN